MITLDEFLKTIETYTREYDHAAAIRAYRNFCKSPSHNTLQTAESYILHMFPGPDDVRISDIISTYGNAGPLSIQQASRWIQEQKLPIIDTLCGPCVSSNVALQLQDFIDNAIPVESEFYRYCQSCLVEPSRALFESFRQQYSKDLKKTRFHPFSPNNWFYMRSSEDLNELFQAWSIEAFADKNPTDGGFLSVPESAAILDVTQSTLLAWLKRHKDVWILRNGRALIPTDTVCRWRDQGHAVATIPNLLVPLLAQVPTKSRRYIQDSITAHLVEEKPQWLLPADALPQQIDGLLYTSDVDIANEQLQNMINAFPIHPLSLLKEITGLSPYELKIKAVSGIIDAQEDGAGNFYISHNEIERIAAINQSFIAFDTVVLAIAEEEGSLFDINKGKDRKALLEYCAENDWWGANHIDCEGQPLDGKKLSIAVLQEDQHLLLSPLSLWLKCKHQPHSVRFKVITNHFSPHFPRTIDNLKLFEKVEHRADAPLIDMMLFLFHQLNTDRDLNDEIFMDALISKFVSNVSTAACITMADFLLFGKYTARRYIFSAHGADIDNTAYSLDAFRVIVAHIVNDDIIATQDLISKALSAKRYADLWLYVALHVYASWRSTDYTRMLPPRLSCTGIEMLARIRDGRLSPQEATEIAEHFIALNKLALNVPNKTAGTAAVPKLYFFCPRSCMEIFGIILAIAGAHYGLSPSSDSFIVPTSDVYLLKQFFGDEFVRACDYKNFSGRRANKALMQSVEYIGRENDQLPPLVAYHLASIMRSHKLSYGNISSTTDIYLHDANFSGLTPEFVIHQMWERGVCSFVTDVMLKHCYGAQYTQLAVAQQTEAIRSLGISPIEASKLLQQIQKMEDRAVETVIATCQDSHNLEKALKNIALGHGIGKAGDNFCLLKALRKECVRKDRQSCLGCRFEIRTKALFLQYAVNHQQLLGSIGTASGPEKRRLEHLCRTTTYPAMAEILGHLDTGMAQSEINLYKDLIKEVSTYGIADGRQN